MENLRKYGQPPFSVAVIHGGPGAPGYMAPVARELSIKWGVLEPLQTASSLEGQIQELKEVLFLNGDLPVSLVGSSWGAMLSFIFSAFFPGYVKKVIMIGSGIFEEKYSKRIMETRLSRLSEDEKKEALALMKILNDSKVQEKDTSLKRFGDLCTKADCFNPITLNTEVLECQYFIHTNVWREVTELRENGKLLALGKLIQCPVVAIHGKYDPHPAEGIHKPLSSVLKDFNFFLLENCGHYPWLEIESRKFFFQILKKELRYPQIFSM